MNNLDLKEKVRNFTNLSKSEKIEVFISIAKQGLYLEDFLKKEGFWCDKEDKDSPLKELPFPLENQMSKEDIEDFIPKLKNLQKKAKIKSYMGYSECRICEKLNGTKTYYNETFAWPEGLQHYIEEHGVQPSASFVLYVRGLIR